MWKTRLGLLRIVYRIRWCRIPLLCGRQAGRRLLAFGTEERPRLTRRPPSLISYGMHERKVHSTYTHLRSLSVTKLSFILFLTAMALPTRTLVVIGFVPLALVWSFNELACWTYSPTRVVIRAHPSHAESTPLLGGRNTPHHERTGLHMQDEGSGWQARLPWACPRPTN